jgi:hypothetical protein
MAWKLIICIHLKILVQGELPSVKFEEMGNIRNGFIEESDG